MKYIYQFAATAILAGIGNFSHASLTTSSGVQSFSGNASVTATSTSKTAVSNTNNNASVATVSLGQFDTSIGVLTGVELQLKSSRTQTIDGTGFKNNGPGRTASGSGTSSALLSTSGFNAAFTPNITQTGSGCGLAMGMTGYISCNWGSQTSASIVTNITGNVASGNLNDYAGTGLINATLTTPDLAATATLTATMGQQSGSTVNYSVAWNGSLEAIYSYMLHAAASFDGTSTQNSLTLDFGVIPQFGPAPTLNFDIFNLADNNRTGLDLDTISGSGDTGAFNIDLTTFSNLAQGTNNNFIASMLTSTLGTFSASYLLDLSDTGIGASNTWLNQKLTLNLIGTVNAASTANSNPESIPEPGTLALLLAGLGMMAWRLKNQPHEKSGLTIA
ncbi:PEP-CTERM sorting domain-containing protein [Nitrosomonas sp.]|uniref:PEP-CTERM sorting domain-containing protein n=1 Tax=Nitrosomonas sp. TaxID=42353 RepID=UPI002635315F|nr:PEP-CTERM sorting domain-containing protein [Nitrosomonas sp.]